MDSPCSSPFQTFDFFQFYNSIPGLSAEVFAVEEAGDLKSLCVVTIQKEKGIKAFFSKRAIIYGGPVIVDNNERIIDFLLNSIGLELYRRVIYIEVRNFSDYGGLKSMYQDAGWKWLPYLNIRIGLRGKSYNEILGLMKYNRRREIRQSLNERAAYRDANHNSEVEALYNILKELYSKKVRLPVPGLDFFLALYNSVFGKVFVVLHNNKIIGGAFCLYYENGSVYTLYYCALRDYHKRIFPTHLSILAAIDFGIKNKLEYLDFMGAGLKGEEYGVRQYKKEFGGDLIEYGRFRKINKKILFAIGESGLWIKKFMKR